MMGEVENDLPDWPENHRHMIVELVRGIEGVVADLSSIASILSLIVTGDPHGTLGPKEWGKNAPPALMMELQPGQP